MFEVDPRTLFAPAPSFALRSDDLQQGGRVPSWMYGPPMGGEGVSPHLEWSGFPAATASFAVTAYDPDAPTGSGYWHWAVANIPPAVTRLEHGAGSAGGRMPEGAVTLHNEQRTRDFAPAGPPEGTGVHRYVFVVHAVDVPRLELPDGCTPAVLGFNLHFHTLARAAVTVLGEYPGA